jgi:hypothetical protein
MKTYRDIAILIGATLALVAILVFGLSYFIDIKPALTEREKKYAHFSYAPIAIAESRPPVISGLRNPLEGAGGQDRGYPSEPLAAIAPSSEAGAPKLSEEDKGVGRRLTLVLVKDKKKLAVLDGVVVKEGDMTKTGRIKMIKRDGVLLQGKEGDTWLTIK